MPDRIVKKLNLDLTFNYFAYAAKSDDLIESKEFAQRLQEKVDYYRRWGPNNSSQCYGDRNRLVGAQSLDTVDVENVIQEFGCGFGYLENKFNDSCYKDAYIDDVNGQKIRIAHFDVGDFSILPAGNASTPIQSYAELLTKIMDTDHDGFVSRKEFREYMTGQNVKDDPTL